MTIPALARKLLRDLRAARWQYLAVATMVAWGVAFFVASFASYRNLAASYAFSYARLRFEDFSVAVHAAPAQVANRLRAVPGVAAVEGRLVEDVAIELPGRTATRRLVGRLVTVPGNRRPLVNDLHLVAGRYLRSATAREVLLEASFARHHRLGPGATIDVVRGAARVRMRVVGIVQSPEYFFVVRSTQDILPYPETFGVMFVAQDVLASMVGKPGLVNELRVRVDDPRRRPAAMREATRLLRAYHPEAPVPREEQPSYQLLDQDLRGFQAFATLFPLLFLSVAGATVYMLLWRMVHAQRPIIGLLRALGVGAPRVVLHYLAAAAVVGALGGLAGSVLGHLLARVTTHWYATFLQTPVVLTPLRWTVLAAGWLIGTGTCVLAGIVPARAAARVRPAQALVEPTDAAARVLPLDRLLPGLRRIRLAWRLPVRSLFRQPRRTLSTIFGVVAAMSLIIVAQGLLDSSTAALDLFLGSAADDVRAEFLDYQDRGLVERIRGWPGVLWAEGTLEVPVEFRKGPRTYAALLVGLEPGTRLQRLADDGGRPVRPSPHGLLFGQTLRDTLGVEAGDVVQVTVPLARVPHRTRPVHAARVAGFVWQPVGTIAYLPADRVRQLLGETLGMPPGAVTSVRVKVAPRALREIRQRLAALPSVGAVHVQADFRRMLADLMAFARRFYTAMSVFGMALAFSITFNTVTMNVLERTNEVATMRTLGVSRARIVAWITAENLLIAAAGVLLGLPAGRALTEAFFRAAQTEEQMALFSMQIVIAPRTYGLATAAVVVVMLLSQLPALAHLQRLDLARATKERAT
ncbi:MAG: FtsX-like permease family protein [Armatimonadota bacterium]|nr:FtsX-like permease family protein [Armatimonadota bacterium]